MAASFLRPRGNESLKASDDVLAQRARRFESEANVARNAPVVAPAKKVGTRR